MKIVFAVSSLMVIFKVFILNQADDLIHKSNSVFGGPKNDKVPQQRFEKLIKLFFYYFASLPWVIIKYLNFKKLENRYYLIKRILFLILFKMCFNGYFVENLILKRVFKR